MVDIVKRTAAEIEDRAHSKRITYLQHQPNLDKLLGSLLIGHETIESEIDNLRLALSVDDATGDALDRLGARVGEDRDSRSDSVYRIFIKARIIVNQSRGNTEDLFEIARVLVNSTNTLKIVEYFPAAFHLIVGDTAPDLVNDMLELIKDGKSAGVNMTGVNYPVATSAMLTLGAIGDYPETNTSTAIDYGALAGAVSKNYSEYRNFVALNNRFNSWTEQTTPTARGLEDITWDQANSQWTSVGGNLTTTANILTSPDGIVWTEQTSDQDFILYGVHSNDGLTVVVGYRNGTDPVIMTSTDGINWVSRTPTISKNIALRSVTYGGSQWVACGDGDGTDTYILTSPDGTTWTERAPTVSKNIQCFGVSYGNGVFVICGAVTSGSCYILTSPDGITWTEVAPNVPKSSSANDVIFGGSRWVIVGAAGYVLTSDDNGLSWVERVTESATSLNGVTYGYGSFVAVGASAGFIGTYIVTSLDGTDWYQRSGGDTQAANDIAFNGLEFVAAGQLSADGYILKTTGI